MKTEMGKKLLSEAFNLALLLDKKNADYSSNNIKKFGLLGILVRLSDKLERAINIHAHIEEGEVPNFESLEDTFKDIAGYGLIALLVAKKEWE